jgi:hypothetical protein
MVRGAEPVSGSFCDDMGAAPEDLKMTGTLPASSGQAISYNRFRVLRTTVASRQSIEWKFVANKVRGQKKAAEKTKQTACSQALRIGWR